MNRILSSIALVLAGGLVAAACSKSVSFDPRACALLSACTDSAGIGDICQELQVVDASPAEDTATGIPVSVLQCVSNATSCADFTACISATPTQAAACAGGQISKCVGSVLVQCDGTDSPEATDCAANDLSCIQGADGAACGTGSCDPTTATPSCQGDSLVACQAIGAGTGGVLTSTNCKLQMGEECSGGTTGSSCSAVVSDTCGVVAGVAQCVGSGASCDATTFPNTCTGSVISACSGGKVAQLDCASFGVPVTCKVGTDGAASCVGTGTECTDETPETCNDGVITYCLWGTTTTLDCTSYGLSGCTTQPGQGSSAALARCVQ